MTAEENVVPDFRGYGQDREVFEKIALVCFQSVLPRKVWLSNFDKKVLSSYMTVADEALAYLILENNFVDWLKIAKKEVEDVKKRRKQTKYTMVAVTGGPRGASAFRKGWSYEGKVRYNEYYDLIEKRREVVGVIAMEKEVLESWTTEENELQSGPTEEETPAKKRKFVPQSGFVTIDL